MALREKTSTSTALLLACDLDRTVIPNGAEPVSSDALTAFRDFVARADVYLVYLTGRHLSSALDAMSEYMLPSPLAISGDVGTTLYFRREEVYEQDGGWASYIARDWESATAVEFQDALSHVSGLVLQEAEKQNAHKVSFYTTLDVDSDALVGEVQRVLAGMARAAIVHSKNVMDGVGYLDVVPASATKLGALRYLQTVLGIAHERVVFAGDSGNDLEPLTSGFKSILVNNATHTFKNQALTAARMHGNEESLYIARGGFQGMNGNYTAGILEGLHYYGFL